MAYRIFICRADNPEKADENPIPLAEWKSVVDDIPELHFYEGEDALPPHIKAPSPSEGLVRWTGHPRRASIWFNHDNGVVYVEGYDAYVNMRMRVLANRLNAQVMDESGRLL